MWLWGSAPSLLTRPPSRPAWLAALPMQAALGPAVWAAGGDGHGQRCHQAGGQGGRAAGSVTLQVLVAAAGMAGERMQAGPQAMQLPDSASGPSPSGSHPCPAPPRRPRPAPPHPNWPAQPHPALPPQVLLTYKGQDVAVLDVESRWQPNKASAHQQGQLCRPNRRTAACLACCTLRCAARLWHGRRAEVPARARPFAGCRWLRRSSATAPPRWSTPQARPAGEPAGGTCRQGNWGAPCCRCLRLVSAPCPSAQSEEPAVLQVPSRALTHSSAAAPFCLPPLALPRSLHDCHRAWPLLPGRQGHRL